MLDRPSADKLAHHRIAAKTVGVVDILVSGEAREDRLAQETGKTMPAVLSRAQVGNRLCRHVRQTKRVVQFAMQQQAAVRTD